MNPDTKIMNETKNTLLKFGNKYLTEKGSLKTFNLVNDLDKFDKELMTSLFKNKTIYDNYVEQINGTDVFKLNQFTEMFQYKEFWEDSYTKYSNKIGITSDDKFINESSDVVLDFPFKDTVLKGSSISEDDSDNDEKFLNEVIAKPEIDEMLEPKIFNNSVKYDSNGANDINNFDEKDNLIIKGNNLIALYSIRKKYANKVKLIYLDPPYNTGNDTFSYNDRFTHSTWLTFMKNRLEVSKDLLSDDGVIFISLDDNEAHYCKVLSDQIFGVENFIADISVKSRASVSNDKIISSSHNHLLFYAKNERIIFNKKSEYGIEPDLTGFNLKDLNGEYKLVPVDGPGGAKKGNPFYEFLGVEGYWRFSLKTMKEKYDRDLIVKRKNSLYQKYYKSDAKNKKKTITTWWDQGFLNSSASSNLKKVFDGKKVFNNPKNENMIKRIIEFSTNENDLVLDFFMGSATTQAVAMKMHRNFIGIEQMDYINTVSVPRLQKVIYGEQGGVSKDLNWQGGGSFVYTELMKKDYSYIKKIQDAKDINDLNTIYESIKNIDDIKFSVDLNKFDKSKEKLSFEEFKNSLFHMLDKNQLYYNYSNIEDNDVKSQLSESDYEFNNSFYK